MLGKLRTDIFNNMFLTYVEEDDEPQGMSNKEYLYHELENMGYNELFEWDISLKNFEMKPNKEYLINWKICTTQGYYDDYPESSPMIYKITEL